MKDSSVLDMSAYKRVNSMGGLRSEFRMFQTEKRNNNTSLGVVEDRCEAWRLFFQLKVQKCTRCVSKTVDRLRAQGVAAPDTVEE